MLIHPDDEPISSKLTLMDADSKPNSVKWPGNP